MTRSPNPTRTLDSAIFSLISIKAMPPLVVVAAAVAEAFDEAVVCEAETELGAEVPKPVVVGAGVEEAVVVAAVAEAEDEPEPDPAGTTTPPCAVGNPWAEEADLAALR
jgi:hypothetical protein